MSETLTEKVARAILICKELKKKQELQWHKYCLRLRKVRRRSYDEED